MSKRFGDVEQAAAETGLSVSWFRQKVLKKQIPHFKVGRRVLFDLDELGELFRAKDRMERKEETLTSV